MSGNPHAACVRLRCEHAHVRAGRFNRGSLDAGPASVRMAPGAICAFRSIGPARVMLGRRAAEGLRGGVAGLADAFAPHNRAYGSQQNAQIF
jgi:hypothetical protein